MEFITTRRGARSLLHQGYKYTINRRTADGQIYWRCQDRNCQGRAITDINDQLVSCNSKHCHPPNSAEIAADLVKEKMKKKANEETTPIPQIYHQALQEVAQHENRESVAAVLPTFSSVKSSLYRRWRERLPPLPRSVDDLNFDGEWSKMLNGEDFMLGSRDSVFMFSTEANLKLLSEADTIYMDGTFQICLCLFYQVFTLHAFKHGQ